METAHKHYFYVLLCADGSYYAGYTIDLSRRLLQHNEGKASKYTRTRLPASLLHSELFETKRAAMQAEYAFKQFSRTKKENYLLEKGSLHDSNTAKL
ncbi:GIY-YIG nuclease family protein [Jeotgalibacillus sp. S-D1]|uniref:GIY-YIG nuclease family protein n=1 Tax=Jeotgalibacillus sp. S-D1 TaxID=2552189 RepID=UPI00105AA90E|nr:GIY-YIG nuclease family protein [Jeotgalibacillus sp. S-D1]TDL30439.1 GIY-YIG nuclease family protein [Jeotgalibacillus sp. S-D1]